LRFDTGDIVQIEASGKCECGRSSGIILSSINGRKINLTLTCEGRLVTLFELDNAMSIIEGIEEYKLVQTGPCKYQLHLASNRNDLKKPGSEAIEILKGLYGKQAEVSIILENAIAPESSGKYLPARTLFPIELERYLA
jgi:phenylacetate-coenzyme A ligase PaaK-like adenylate-forming protein